jgi:ribosome-associated protein YbcJ (S4-like RNA binding protein)
MFDPTSQPLSYDLLTHSKETLHQMLKKKIDSSMKTLTEMMKAEKIIASGGDWSGFKTVVFMVDKRVEVTNREEYDYRSRLIKFVREVYPSCTDDDTTAYHKGLAIHCMFDLTSPPLSYDFLKHPKETLHQMLKEKIDHFQITLFRMMKADKIIASGGDWRAVKDWTIPVNNVKSMVDI